MKKITICVVWGLLIHIMSIGHSATITVGTGSNLDLGGSSISHDDLSVTNRGELDLNSSTVLMSNFINESNATTYAGNSQLNITGDWQNNGNFLPMTSTVRFLDGVQSIAQLRGNSTFNNLIISTNSGKTYVLESGQTQEILNHLEIIGVNGNLLQLISDVVGEQSLLWLDDNATQLIDYVEVVDNYGTEQVIAPGDPASYNSIQGNNVRGWFGTPLQFPVPLLSTISLLLMVALMLLIVRLQQKKTKI